VVFGVIGVRVGVVGGHHSKRGRLGRHVHRRRCFVVDDFFGRVRPRCSLADSSALMGEQCVGLCLPGV
jgi:hypothetical protein